MSALDQWLERSRLRQLRARLKPSFPVEGWLQQLGKALNSPLAITLVSGLFVAGITNHWQAHAARVSRMEKTLVDFADQYAKLLNLLPTEKDRELTVRRLKLKIDQDSRDGQAVDKQSQADLDAADKKYEAAAAQLDRLPDSNALTIKVRAAFTGADIDRDCQELDRLIDEIGTTADLDTALHDHAKALVLYRRVIGEMGSRLRE